MKQGTIINRIIMLLLMGVILLYLGGAAWRWLRDPYPTVQAYSYQVDDALEATGYLVREEQVLTGSGGIVRLTPAEGEKVSAGATVALLYADEAALERDQRLETLQAEESQLSSAIALAGESSQQTERSSQVVLEALTKLRAAVESGDFTRLESQTSAFKSAVYQQAQRYGDADELQAALSATRSEIDSLRAQNSRDMGRVTTAQSGIFSGQVDGYETILTPETVTALTPQQLESLEDRAHPVGAGSLAKIITDSTWYFACALPQEQAVRLTLGSTVKVRFSRDWSGEVEMKVTSISQGQEGRVAVVLSSNDALFARTLTAGRLNLIACPRLEGPVRLLAKVRYRMAEQPCTVEQTGEETLRLTFDQPQRAITPGQTVALYDGDVVVGGAVIRASAPNG